MNEPTNIEPLGKRLPAVALMIAALTGTEMPTPWRLGGQRVRAIGTLAPIVPGQRRRRPGRNARCHCGSGKKFKRCHGKP